jgi:hypothetical protein
MEPVRKPDARTARDGMIEESSRRDLGLDSLAEIGPRSRRHPKARVLHSPGTSSAQYATESPTGRPGEFPRRLTMGKLLRRALLLFGAYAALLAAVVVAGFLGGAVGIWASILWGAGVLFGIVLYGRRRSTNRAAKSS